MRKLPNEFGVEERRDRGVVRVLVVDVELAAVLVEPLCASTLAAVPGMARRYRRRPRAQLGPLRGGLTRRRLAAVPLRFMMPGVLSAVLVFALSKADTVTIVNLVIWAVVFPALVTGLIAFAVIRGIGERHENAENDRRRRRRRA